MRALITLIISVAFAQPANGTTGMADWSVRTPGGNTITSGGTLLHLQGNTVLSLTEYYFYRGHVLGQIKGDDWPRKGTWFLANESDGKLEVFDSEAVWNERRSELALVPRVWERQFSGDPNGDLTMLFFAAYFLWYISLPLLAIWMIALYRSVAKERLHWRKPWSLFIYISIGCIIIRLFLFFNLGSL